MEHELDAQMAKILVVEDDKTVAEQLRTLLTFEHHNVEAVHDGSDAASNLKAYHYDVIILDWELPGKSGVDVLKEFRARGGKTPILMLTGKGSTDEKEHGLDAGADDYLTKPFAMKEVAARVRALLRRPAPVAADNILRTGDLSLDASRYQVEKNGCRVSMLPKEFALLEFLMRHPNSVFSSEALLNRVWPADSEATEEALRSTMKRLRKKVDPDGALIKTVHGVGYLLET
jgi:DNA-binding response OmpR family regulator